MTQALVAPAVPWGERTDLLPKQMLYALSLDVTMKASGILLTVANDRAGDDTALVEQTPGTQDGSAIWTKNRGIGHLFDDTIVVTPEGLRCDAPKGKIVAGRGQVGDASDPRSADLDMDLTADVGEGRKLLIACAGVVHFDGGPAAFRRTTIRSLAGSAFISTSYVSSSVTYRWLERRQLFGIGRVRGADESGERLLVFSFDLYAAA